MRETKDSAAARLGVMAELQRSVARIDLAEADRHTIITRLGDLGGHIEADSNLVESLMRSQAPPLQRLSVLLKLALGESAPLGPAANRAKAAALKLARAPEVRVDLAKAPELIERLRPLTQAA
jgi:hypothetical protein